MLNRKNPVAINGGPRWWPTISLEEKEVINKTCLLPSPVKILDNDSSRAPKHPKKRFLETAVAHQLLQQQQQQQQVQVTKSEDNSALMQLAEMCVVYQKNGQPNALKYCWSPAATAIKPVDLDMPHSSISSSNSPKAGSPSWGWASGPVINEEDENEEPLDLSGERTIRANQQDLIDHIVEKLCAGNCRSASSDLKPIHLMSVLEIRASKDIQNSSSEVSSTIDHIKEIKVDIKDIRKDLPLKKRDPAVLNQMPCSDQTTVVACDSSTSQRETSIMELEPVSSSNNLKPAQRSCKGKRYLEFMYEGRIPLGSRVKRMEYLDSTEVSETTATGSGGRKTRGKVKRLTNEPSTLSMRGRRARKFS